MSFIHHLSTHEPYESVSNPAAAAEKRFLDASYLLADSNRHLGALYLVGYSTEMLLKVAYYRVNGLRGPDPIGTLFKLATRWLKQYGYNGHHINGLLLLLESERNRLGRPSWSAGDKMRLQTAVGRVSANWSEVLRYRYTTPPRASVEEAFAGAQWLLENRTMLWR